LRDLVSSGELARENRFRAVRTREHHAHTRHLFSGLADEAGRRFAKARGDAFQKGEAGLDGWHPTGEGAGEPFSGSPLTLPPGELA